MLICGKNIICHCAMKH